jgi:hypothetical protein
VASIVKLAPIARAAEGALYPHVIKPSCLISPNFE